MKYSTWLSANAEFFDELFIESKHINIIPDIFKDYPNKTVIVSLRSLPDEEQLNSLITYSTIGNLVCLLLDLNFPIEVLAEHNIKFYYGIYATTFWEIEAMIEKGVEYISIAAPLVFQVDKLKNYTDKVKFRANPLLNYPGKQYNNMQTRTGGFIRPEDAILYEGIIYVFDFEEFNGIREKTLLELYTSYRYDFDLAILIPGQEHILNSSLPSDFGTVRIDCQQRCKGRPNSCHYCDSAFNFGDSVVTHMSKVVELLKGGKADGENLIGEGI